LDARRPERHGVGPANGPACQAGRLHDSRGTIAEIAQKAGFKAAIGAPILVGGVTWGAIVAISSAAEPIPEGAEERLGVFTELVATAVANLQSQNELRGLADEQAALRRVATLVAEGVSADELFLAVANEVGNVLAVPGVVLDRFDPDGTAVTVALANDPDWEMATRIVYHGRRWPKGGGGLHGLVWATGRPARIDSYSQLAGESAAAARTAGVGSGCATPIVVEGRLWGLIRVFTRGTDPLPDDTEVRLQNFTQLVAAALSNAQASRDLNEIATEQTALRRVATLVAEGAESGNVFAAVCAEAGPLVGASSVNLSHYTPDGLNVTMAGWSLRDTHIPVGTSFPLAPDTVGGAIVSTHAPVRIDSWEGASSDLAKLVRERGVKSSVGAPVVVEGPASGTGCGQ